MVQIPQGVRLDGAARIAQPLPILLLRDHMRALLRNDIRGVAHVCAKLVIFEQRVRCLLKRRGPGRFSYANAHAIPSSVAARISARCTVLIPAP